MSVMTRNPDGSLSNPGTITGRPLDFQEMQRQSVVNQLGQPPAGQPQTAAARSGKRRQRAVTRATARRRGR